MLDVIMLSFVMQAMPATATEVSDRAASMPVVALAGDRPKTGTPATPPKRPKADPANPPKRPKVPPTANPGPVRPKAGPGKGGTGKGGEPGGKGRKKGD